MTKRPWTPGPWFSLRYASGRGEDWGIGIPSGDGYIAVARVHRVAQRDTAHEVANARLIAAAPELYEALDDLVNYLSNTAHHNALPVAFARGVLRTAGGDS